MRRWISCDLFRTHRFVRDTKVIFLSGEFASEKQKNGRPDNFSRNIATANLDLASLSACIETDDGRGEGGEKKRMAIGGPVAKDRG